MLTDLDVFNHFIHYDNTSNMNEQITGLIFMHEINNKKKNGKIHRNAIFLIEIVDLEEKSERTNELRYRHQFLMVQTLNNNFHFFSIFHVLVEKYYFNKQTNKVGKRK